MVGLTKHRLGLLELSTVSPEYAKFFVDYSRELSEILPGNESQNYFLSDEWYILAKSFSRY